MIDKKKQTGNDLPSIVTPPKIFLQLNYSLSNSNEKVDFFFSDQTFTHNVSLVPMTEFKIFFFFFANKTFTTPTGIIFVRNTTPSIAHISSFKPFTCSVKFVTTNVRFTCLLQHRCCFYSNLKWYYQVTEYHLDFIRNFSQKDLLF